MRHLVFSCVLLTLAVGISSAQTGRVPSPSARRQVAAPNKQPAAKNSELSFIVPPVATYDGVNHKIDFGTVFNGLVAVTYVPDNGDPTRHYLTVNPDNPIVSIAVQDGSGARPSPTFKTENKGQCSPEKKTDGGKNVCKIVVGFMPSDDHSDFTGTLTITYKDGTADVRHLAGKGGPAAPCVPPDRRFFPLNRGFWPGLIYPTSPPDVDDDLVVKLYGDFGNPIRKSVVNCFYNTTGLLSWFNQVQSIYNAASGAATVNANIASLNFVDGTQLTIGTYPQVTPSNTTQPSGTPGAGVPTLSASGAAQAAQNMLNGGTVFAEGRHPLIYGQFSGLLTLDAVVHEGIDLQKFNNTSITATNPSTHTFVGLESYLECFSSNNAPNSNNPAGSIFLSARYGYSLATHTYSRENGFGRRVNYQLAQIGAGIKVSGVLKLAAYRGFGPSQVYIDSITMNQTTVNNFKSWSVAIAYESSSSGKGK